MVTGFTDIENTDYVAVVDLYEVDYCVEFISYKCLSN